jgi:4-amino-4-deoxy-L-arabinose transferase-like glycosyltransferase
MVFQLVLYSAIFFPAIFFHFKKKDKTALWMLVFAAIAARLLMVTLDPFLHDWDERFHAVVAKNIMTHPFQPMIRLEAILPYKHEDWCCNYIWVHKQPLFLWQMALSMKVFGVNTIALRLPDVIMGAFVILAVYRIALIWTNNLTTAFFSALLIATSNYHLELTSGLMALDHNDLMMGGYVTLSIWSFFEYTKDPNRKWIILTGIFVGCAILTKWLTGLLVFGGWGIWLLLSEQRFQLKFWKDMLFSMSVCVLTFLPWQLYIQSVFPIESAASYAHNVKHIFESLGHPGDNFTHTDFMTTAYSGRWFLWVMGIGFILSWLKNNDRRLSAAMMAMFVVVYAFFSLVVATKMRGLTFPVTAIGFIWIAIGLSVFVKLVQEKILNRISVTALSMAFGIVIALLTSYYAFQPKKIAAARMENDITRNIELHNTNIYRKLNQYVSPNEVVLNCKSFDDTEVRFWQPNNAYHWYPTASQVDSLLNAGYELSAFKSHTDQILPDYIQQNKLIKILDLEIK